MPGYGRQYQILISEASAMLISDSTDLSNIYGVTKEDLAIGIIQTEIDLYALVKQNKYWGAGGNLNHGRKWPILFAGLLLNDADMKNISSYPFIPVTPSNGADITNPFAEEQTHFYVSQSQINATHVPYWGDQSHSPYVGPDYRVTAIPYTSTDLELPEWGIDNTTVMTADNNNWATLYRQECGCGICGYVLAALAISGAKALYNKPEFFDYCDRYMTVTTKNTSDRQWSRFCEQMWDAYRADYGLGYVSVSGGVRHYETPSLSNGIIK